MERAGKGLDARALLSAAGAGGEGLGFCLFRGARRHVSGPRHCSVPGRRAPLRAPLRPRPCRSRAEGCCSAGPRPPLPSLPFPSLPFPPGRGGGERPRRRGAEGTRPKASRSAARRALGGLGGAAPAVAERGGGGGVGRVRRMRGCGWSCAACFVPVHRQAPERPAYSPRPGEAQEPL
jgi:hypothetical protein